MTESKKLTPDQRLRLDAIRIYGGRCEGTIGMPCRWLNEDNTLGCSDERALQFDHIDGGGGKARREGKDSNRQIFYKIKNGSGAGRFRLLCATCHEIRKKVDKQGQGARQHRQPARVRRSQQKEGQPERRVNIKTDTTRT